ncbi:MAG: hypothetical protein ACI8YQ_001867 [Polaribacter sp.]
MEFPNSQRSTNYFTMRNIVGQTPRGKDFYPRDTVINKIYRRLDAGSHIFLSAPRRAGKTSIMRFMEESPRKGYAFVYLNVEDVEDSEDYFRTLSEELLNSSSVTTLMKATKKTRNLFEDFADHVKKIKVWGIEVETQSKEQPRYSKEFEKLMSSLDTTTFTIVMLVDEFPVTVEQIEKKTDAEESRRFLHINRSIRQRAKRGIQFLYTGSIGLPNIARKLNATATINDLNVVEVPPLSRKEATDFIRKLFRNYSLKSEKGTTPYILDKLRWLMPFFIQLMVQMLIDESEITGKPINKETVDKVFEKASNHRNNIYFENYYSRLDKSLVKEDAKLAKMILSKIAVENEVALDAFKKEKDGAAVLEILEFDGYINSNGGKFSFNSPILQNWWIKYAND